MPQRAHPAARTGDGLTVFQLNDRFPDEAVA